MLFNFVGRVTSATALKESLDASSQRTRELAHRVAGATLNGASGFALPSDGGAATGEKIDLESAMVQLSDEQVRYEMTAKLLEKAYAGVRTSLRNG